MAVTPKAKKNPVKKKKSLCKARQKKLDLKLKNEKIRLDIKNKCLSDPLFKEYKKKRQGRPTKYETWMDEFAMYFLSDGKSLVELAAELQVDKSTLTEWKSNSSFSVAISLGMTSCQAWWEKESRLSLRDKYFNTGLWTQNIKGRFKHDWGEFKKDEDSDLEAFKALASLVMDKSKGITINDKQDE